MKFGLDEYARNARLKPALLVALPAAWTITVWAPGTAVGWGGIWALFVAAGGTLLLSQLARDRGKRKERELFDLHGGGPTERLLSHVHAPNKARLRIQHARLQALLPDLRIPSAEEEMRDPSAAREIYETYTRHLIARTRGDSLLFDENVNFGFRRNLWGLKPFGIAFAAVAAVALGLRLYSDFSRNGAVLPAHVVFEALNVATLALWLFRITPRWVMLAGEAYAQRLLDALDTHEIKVKE